MEAENFQVSHPTATHCSPSARMYAPQHPHVTLYGSIDIDLIDNSALSLSTVGFSRRLHALGWLTKEIP